MLFRILVTMGSDGLIKNWSFTDDSSDDAKMTLVSTLSGHSNWVWDAAFSADSSFMLSGSSDGTARLWDVESGEIVCVYLGHSKSITSVAINDSIFS